MTFLKRILQKVKEWLNKDDQPKYLSGKSKWLTGMTFYWGLYGELR